MEIKYLHTLLQYFFHAQYAGWKLTSLGHMQWSKLIEL